MRKIYCHCAFTKLIPDKTRKAVTDKLSENGGEYLVVPDLCRMASCQKEKLKNLVYCDEIKLAACYPRAVKGLFEGAGVDIKEKNIEIVNMRVETPDAVMSKFFDGENQSS